MALRPINLYQPPPIACDVAKHVSCYNWQKTKAKNQSRRTLFLHCGLTMPRCGKDAQRRGDTSRQNTGQKGNTKGNAHITRLTQVANIVSYCFVLLLRQKMMIHTWKMKVEFKTKALTNEKQLYVEVHASISNQNFALQASKTLQEDYLQT